MNLTGIVVKVGDALVVSQGCTKFIDLIKVEVASSDHSIKSTIYCTYLLIGWADIPLPKSTVSIGVTLDSMYHISLDIRKECKGFAVKVFAHPCRIDTCKGLLRIIKGLHSFRFRNCISRNLLQTGSHTQSYSNHCCSSHKYIICILHHIPLD